MFRNNVKTYKFAKRVQLNCIWIHIRMILIWWFIVIYFVLKYEYFDINRRVKLY